MAGQGIEPRHTPGQLFFGKIVENLLFHSAEKIRGGIIQFFGNLGFEEIYA